MPSSSFWDLTVCTILPPHPHWPHWVSNCAGSLSLHPALPFGSGTQCRATVPPLAISILCLLWEPSLPCSPALPFPRSIALLHHMGTLIFPAPCHSSPPCRSSPQSTGAIALHVRPPTCADFFPLVTPFSYHLDSKSLCWTTVVTSANQLILT